MIWHGSERRSKNTKSKKQESVDEYHINRNGP